jgi:transcription elongation GreA/GreB family factor
LKKADLSVNLYDVWGSPREGKVETMSVAFTREESAETAAEVELPDRPISRHPNLVTASGLEALTNAMKESRTAYDAAQKIEDISERRRAVSVASRDMRYFADHLRTAQLVTPSADFSAVAFGHRVTFRRDDGRRQAFRIVSEDEADASGRSHSRCRYDNPIALRCFEARVAFRALLAVTQMMPLMLHGETPFRLEAIRTR